MDSFDWNRLAVAGLLSICVLTASRGIGSVIIQNTAPIKSAFFIADNQDDAMDLTAANPIKGKELAAQQCSLCHTFGKNEANKIGPNLYDIMAHPIASVSSFNYSESLKKHHQENWDAQKLNLWLAHPTNFASDTIMAYPGVSSKQDRIDIIAYLKEISPSTPPVEKKVATEVKQPESSKTTDPNVAQGKSEYQQYCAVCHTDIPDGNTRLGPNLYGIVNKPIASQANYTYSGALKIKKTNWTESNLDQWIKNPQQWAPGNKMVYQGVSSTEIRQNIILYLNSLSPQDKH